MNPEAARAGFMLMCSFGLLILIVVADWLATVPSDPPWADRDDDRE